MFVPIHINCGSHLKTHHNYSWSKTQEKRWGDWNTKCNILLDGVVKVCIAMTVLQCITHLCLKYNTNKWHVLCADNMTPFRGKREKTQAKERRNELWTIAHLSVPTSHLDLSKKTLLQQREESKYMFLHIEPRSGVTFISDMKINLQEKFES